MEIMTAALKSALSHAAIVAEKLPASLQDTVAVSILERIEQIGESLSMFNLSASSMATDWDNDLDAAYDNYDDNHALQTG